MAKKKTKDPLETVSFEEALERLESLVEKLEEGEIPLEESIDSYTQGMALVRHCMSKLEKAEETLKQLQGDSELIDAPLEDDGDEHA